MKMVAGWKLWIRKPPTEPERQIGEQRQHRIVAVPRAQRGGGSACSAMPEASPSSPSIRLTAFDHDDATAP